MSDILYESNTAGEDSTSAAIYGAYWETQTFKPSTPHTITSVKLKLFRDGGSPGTVTASIRATSSSLPTGSDVVSGTTNGNAFTDTSPGALYEFTFGSGTILSSETEYAICLRIAATASVNNIRWRFGSTAPYTRGESAYSINSGSTWVAYGAGTQDYQFEEYGIGLGESAGMIAIVGETLHYVGQSGAEYTIQGTAV